MRFDVEIPDGDRETQTPIRKRRATDVMAFVKSAVTRFSVLVVGLALAPGAGASFPRSTEPIPPAAASESLVDVLLQELDCDCQAPGDRYVCARLPAFGDIEWTHPGQADFARKVAAVVAQLPDGYALRVQGIADSRRIPRSNAKDWGLVDGRCRTHTGEITNLDLAWLRSCTTRDEIERILGPDRGVGLESPIDYSQQAAPGFRGDEYKAAVIFLRLPQELSCRPD